MNNPSSPGLRPLRAASLLLLLSAAAHGAGHYLLYVDPDVGSPERRALRGAMEGHVVDPRLGTTLWDLLQMFSLSFSLLLLFTGALNLVLLRGRPEPALTRRLAAGNLGFWMLALALFGFVHRAMPPMVISTAAVLLYGAAFVATRPRTRS